MKSPADSRHAHQEPEAGEIAEAFHRSVVPLPPPPGAFDAVRRRAAARRRRRSLAAVAAVGVVVAGSSVVVALAGQDGAGAGPAKHTLSPAAGSHPASGSASPEPSAPQPEPTVPPDTVEPQESSRPTCTTTQLTLAVGEVTAGAGSVFLPLEFTNAGSGPCVMLGHPGVSLVTGEGDGSRQIGRPAVRGAERGEAEPLELAPGESAAADLRLARAENYGTELCDPVTAAGLRVYPPNQRDALFVPYENVTGCGSAEVELLSVTVVYPRTG